MTGCGTATPPSGTAPRAETPGAATRAPVEEARAHHLAGVTHARRGHHDRSERELGRARTGYHTAGARWLLSTMDSELRDAVPPVRSDEDAVGRLTRRERQIAELVAVGLTNQEIATRLFLSRRTVESHLSHIFPKLNVRTRSALVHQLTQRT